MVYRDKPEEVAGEEYELAVHESGNDNDPLLPQYERYERASASLERNPSPSSEDSLGVHHARLLLRHRRRGRTILCFGILLALLLPTAAFVGCLYGQGKFASATWDQLPDNMRQWLGSLIPAVKTGEDPDFPIDVGYPGPTPTGKEAGLIVTAPAMPMYTPISPLIPPKADKESFYVPNHWGNLSPYHSVKSHGLPESSQLIPDGCELDELHWLQRHGARYPTSNPHGPAGFAHRIKEAKGWKASGELKFLNNWTYKLGAELLTPYGRSQLYNLGVAARVKYGFLLDRFKDRLPVLRTESQDRMLRSAQNWAAGFFGIPDQEQYHLEVIIEAPGFNCSLAPYHSCPNDNKVYQPTQDKLAEWDAVFLKAARKRIQKLIDGYELSLTDVKEMMDTCAYETVALGYSAFCPLFTDKEWKGYQYRWDIYWWYAASFGSPVARAEGLGWVQELTARLTHTPITQFNSSINSTLHDKIHFPVNDPLYVDFTHDTTFAQLLPTINLTTFSALGAPPTDHIPAHWPFVSSKFAPFATNLQVQVLTCSDRAASASAAGTNWWPFHENDTEDVRKRAAQDGEAETTAEPQPAPAADAHEEPEADSKSRYVRLILNDAPVPLTGINGCKKNDNGLCALDAFVSSLKTFIGEIDFAHDCYADYEYNADEVLRGQPNK